MSGQGHADLRPILTALAARMPKNLTPVLPLFFSLHGKPYTLDNHFPFEPAFDVKFPKKMTIRASRQIGKTQTTAARLLLTAASRAYSNTLYVTPLHEQCTRFSGDVLRPLAAASPLRSMMFDGEGLGSVLRRRLRNGSVMYFSYAFIDATRIRSISKVEFCAVDEMQDFDLAHMPVVDETQSAADLGVMTMSGTSKTKDTALEKAWEDSSQAYWHTRCCACGFVNIAGIDGGGHLLSMIGPDRADISYDRPAVLCHSCRAPIRPHLGYWVHRYPERVAVNSGFHMPQVIFPGHYARRDKWRVLLGKQAGRGGYTPAKFMNEVLGEPYDRALKLVSEDDVRKASVGGPNTLEHAALRRGRHDFCVLGIDWGGGGEDGSSTTTIAAAVMHNDGAVEVVFAERLTRYNGALGEAERVVEVARALGVNYVAHDYNGAGASREGYLIQRGVGFESLLPMMYAARAASGRSFVEYVQPQGARVRGFYSLDKARSLQMCAHAIQCGLLRFYADDYSDPDNPGILRDWLALAEFKIETPGGADVYTIRRLKSAGPDDFAHACNFAACALWQLTQAWPSFVGRQPL